jgi:hypothetical protein
MHPKLGECMPMCTCKEKFLDGLVVQFGGKTIENRYRTLEISSMSLTGHKSTNSLVEGPRSHEPPPFSSQRNWPKTFRYRRIQIVALGDTCNIVSSGQNGDTKMIWYLENKSTY